MQDELRYWKYCDDLSVIDAALLIVGLNPGVITLIGNSPETASLVQSVPGGIDKYYHEHDFRAVFKALRSAILTDKVPANITRLCRSANYTWFAGEAHAEEPQPHEVQLYYDALLITPGQMMTNVGVITGGYEGAIFYVKEPDWHQTTVRVEDLKAWLISKNDRPDFFFSKAEAQELFDEDHPRYSAKLAACVSAWYAIETAAPNKTVKQTLERWFRENAAQFGLVDDEGNPLHDVVAELAKVVNWNKKGGAPKTSANAQKEQPSAPSSNFSQASDGTDVPF